MKHGMRAEDHRALQDWIIGSCLSKVCAQQMASRVVGEGNSDVGNYCTAVELVILAGRGRKTPKTSRLMEKQFLFIQQQRIWSI